MKNSYGFDRLSRDMLFFAVILDIFALLFFGQVAGLILCSASAIIAACTLFRILSTNVNKRTSELRGYESSSEASKASFKSCLTAARTMPKSMLRISISAALTASRSSALRAAREKSASPAAAAEPSFKSVPKRRK